jgi:hypothetical protein
MPKSTESVNIELYDLLRGRGYSVTMYDSAADKVPIPEESDVFQFEFKSDEKRYGTVTITVDDSRFLIIYFNTSVTRSSDENTGWVKFIDQMGHFAITHGLKKKLKDMSKLSDDMKVRQHRKNIAEGYYGNKHTSYSDNGPPTIKMIIKHNKTLGETDVRYRYVERIFLENEMGERVLVPSTKPSIGRVFARHLAEGGQYNDQRWGHISEMVEDVKKLGGFVRATKSGQFNESVQRIVTEAANHYQSLRESLKRLQSTRGYNNYFESWQPTIMEDNDTSNLTELFRTNTLDTRIESALPILSRLNLTITETNEASMFEAWADSLIDEALIPNQPLQKEELIDLLGNDSDIMSLGPDASNAIGELSGILEKDGLNARLMKAASLDANRDARPIIIAWMSEQLGREYDEILDKLQSTDEEPVIPEPEEPAEPPPEQPKEPAAPVQNNIPSPPPVKEAMSLLDHIKRLSGI